ncbi:MAG: acyltransferase family protein [Oscillospiraceae bacterium]|nr:acyltransferase family protein [Oscillospiraceae bacterium]
MKRKDGIDLIKAIAIFCVVLAHTCSPGYFTTGANFCASVFWGSLFRMAVPLFLMCTGALLLDPEREFKAVPFLRKNYLRILIALFFWAAMYKLYHLAVGGALSGSSLLFALKELVLFKHEFHLYYLHITLLLYAFLPILRVLTKHASRGTMIYLLVLWALTGIIYPTLRPFWPFSLLEGVPAQWLMNMAWASFGYALLGHFLMKYPMKRWLGAVLFAAGFAVVFGGTLIMSRSRGSFYEGFLEGMSVGVALKAAGLFGLLSGVKLRRTGLVRFIAKASFCVYLIHIFIISEAARLGWSILLLPCIVSIPLAALVTLAICCGIWFVLSKIPVVKKYLV